MVECTALEMRHTCKGIVGSNPTLSAIKHNYHAMKHVRKRAVLTCVTFDCGAISAARLKQPVPKRPTQVVMVR